MQPYLLLLPFLGIQTRILALPVEQTFLVSAPTSHRRALTYISSPRAVPARPSGATPPGGWGWAQLDPDDINEALNNQQGHPWDTTPYAQLGPSNWGSGSMHTPAPTGVQTSSNQHNDVWALPYHDQGFGASPSCGNPSGLTPAPMGMGTDFGAHTPSPPRMRTPPNHQVNTWGVPTHSQQAPPHDSSTPSVSPSGQGSTSSTTAHTPAVVHKTPPRAARPRKRKRNSRSASIRSESPPTMFTSHLWSERPGEVSAGVGQPTTPIGNHGGGGSSPPRGRTPSLSPERSSQTLVGGASIVGRSHLAMWVADKNRFQQLIKEIGVLQGKGAKTWMRPETVPKGEEALKLIKAFYNDFVGSTVEA